MKFDADKQRGAKYKELGPITCCSVVPNTTYQDLVEKGMKEFLVMMWLGVMPDLSTFWLTVKEANFLITSTAIHGIYQNTSMPMVYILQKPSYTVFKLVLINIAIHIAMQRARFGSTLRLCRSFISLIMK